MISSMLCLAASGQLGVDYDLKKPAKYENRILASEKSNNGKKFKKSRRFVQNTITHFNYYYNANEKLKMVIARAKASFKDDYTRLLPFYNYSLDGTLAQKKELDSVIYKCTAGILIHDTRNDWIDNLYLLIGKSYYFRKDFDSAYITLQFLNYAFAPKEKDGYDKPIGSNYNADEGGNADIVSTLEKRNILQKTFSLPPSRNESLLWKIRTYIAKDQFAEASGLLEILEHDPQFPLRLHPSLQEMKALWFYRQDINDSAAFYLEKALPAAENLEETARWEYLIAQLYDKTGNSFESRTFFERTVAHTYNPVLEVYARLNAIRQNKEGGDDFITRNIEALVKMARKDRYESYRDIIYYTAAQMELERNNKPGAIAFLLLCTKAGAQPGNYSGQRNKAFMQLANLSYEDKNYRAAKNYYDSLNLGDVSSLGDINWLPDRKAALRIIVSQLDILQRQDSLQRMAALPPMQRDALIKKLVRTLRRQQGLRDEADTSFSNTAFNNNNKTAPDMFSNNSGSADWYFYNQSLKAKGYTDFRNKWGNRPNVDNWQVTALMRNAQLARSGQRISNNPSDSSGGKTQAPSGPSHIDFKSLLANLPLTPEKMKKSMDSVEKALFVLGKTSQEGLPDYSYAIHSYDSLLEKFPDTKMREETLFNLYYCYKKLGDEAGASRILDLLKQKYPAGPYTAKILNPDPSADPAVVIKNRATRSYEQIYTAFIEGRFAEAMAQKKTADSIYGDKYWTPQLLYIESIYLIRTQQDAHAKAILVNIQSKFPRTPMAAKAATLLDVLNRRRQIEDYLTKLQVKRAADDDTVAATKPERIIPANDKPRLVRNDSNMLIRKEDTAQLARAKIHVPTAGIQPSTGGTPGINGGPLKVDSAGLNKIKMDSGQLARLHRQVDSLQAAMVKAAADSAQSARLRQKADSIRMVMKKIQMDSMALAARVRSINSAFSNTPETGHLVMILLEKVDPVYVTETKTAFDRYNLENYYGQSLTTTNIPFNDSAKFIMIGSFANADAAMDYLAKAKPLAPREIIPWLPATKYSLLIISAPNLNLLLNNKDLPNYRKFLSTVYPGKF